MGFKIILVLFCCMLLGFEAGFGQNTKAPLIPKDSTIHVANHHPADTSKSRGDTTTNKTHSDSVAKPELKQVRIGIDISSFLFNEIYPGRTGYEFQADYNWKKNIFLAAEAGFGRGKVNRTNLAYNTNGAFIRLGLEQNLFGQDNEKDFDNAFIGLRYGTGFGRMGNASFIVNSPFGTTSSGEVPGKSYWVHWGELVGGVKVLLFKNIYAGWTIRGKFLINPGTFKELTPNYIPGFGDGDKNTIFDFNFYLSYALRWH